MEPTLKSCFSELADALGVVPSFLEQDWYSMRILSKLRQMEHPTLSLVFSGGTSLLKGFELLQRFSEDLDFKVDGSEETSRAQRSAFRKDLIAILSQNPDEWQPDLENILIGNGSKFFKVPILYSAEFPPSDALRSYLKLEVSFEQPAIATQSRPLQSFIGKFLGQEAEVKNFPCVSPIETAANKLSALTWRVLSRDRTGPKDDPTLIRHLHDLAALKEVIQGSDLFHRLVLESLAKDISRADYTESSASPQRQLKALVDLLHRDEKYQSEYHQFVFNMSYGAEPPSFESCLSTLDVLIAEVSSYAERQTNPAIALKAPESYLSESMQTKAQQFLDLYLEGAIRALIQNMDRVKGVLEVDANKTKSFRAGDFLWSLKRDDSVGLSRISNGQEITPQTVTAEEMNIIRDFILEVHNKYGLKPKLTKQTNYQSENSQNQRPKL